MSAGHLYTLDMKDFPRIQNVRLAAAHNVSKIFQKQQNTLAKAMPPCAQLRGQPISAVAVTPGREFIKCPGQ
jgi:hypothetical protein